MLDYEVKFLDYEETGVSTEVMKQLEAIAMSKSYELQERGGIRGVNSDSWDFPEISIFSLQFMLAEAYKLGMAAGKKAK